MNPPYRPQSSTAIDSALGPHALLMCFSHLRWDFVFQRPQHLLTRAANDLPVVFVEEPVHEPCAAPFLRRRQAARNITVAVPVLPPGLDVIQTEAAQRALVDALLAELQPRRLVTWFYTPMALAFAGHLQADVCVYDCMDELANFKGASPRLALLERQLMRRASLVFTGGRSLYEAKRDLHPEVHAFPSSIDTAHFRPARQGLPDPADQARLARPRLGYFGVIDERMDLDLVAAMAERRPEWQFVMVGPVVKIDPASLPALGNVAWLGRKDYQELPAYLANWDIGLMPFAINDATRFISPTKTPEYLAAGLPVVSTPVVDVVASYGDAGLVEIAGDALAAIHAAERAMARPAGTWLADVDRVLATTSWDRTWARMAALIIDRMDVPAAELAAAASQRNYARA